MTALKQPGPTASERRSRFASSRSFTPPHPLDASPAQPLTSAPNRGIICGCENGKDTFNHAMLGTNDIELPR